MRNGGRDGGRVGGREGERVDKEKMIATIIMFSTGLARCCILKAKPTM